MKLDAHQHFWDLDRLRYPWLTPALRPLYRTFEPPDLEPLLSATGIDGTIVVQATHMEAETAWFLSLARAYPFIKGVVGWLDLTAADLAEKASRFMAEGPLCALRHQAHDEPAVDWLLQRDVVRGLQTVAGLGLAYDLLVRPQHLPLLPALFDAVPGMRWVIDHIAKPGIAGGEIEPWLAGMRQAARFPNVVCKLSGMITEADHAHWTVSDLRPYFERVLELFGPSRLMWGSDWPVCLLAGSYTQVHDLVAELIAPLSADEQAAIWGGTAREVYKLTLSSYGTRPNVSFALHSANTGRSFMEMNTWPKGISVITLFVEDLAATRQFYQEVFGLPVVFEDDNSTVFKFDNMLVNLLKSTAAGELIEPARVASREAGSRFVFTIDVDDVDAMCAELAARGVELLNGPMDRPWGVRTASFVDPGGHIWEIAK